MFDSHHGVIAQMLLDQVAFLDQRITQMEDQAIAALAQVEQSWGVDADGETGPGRGTGPDSPVLAAAHRLAEIPGVSVWLAIVIIAEIGLNMAAVPHPGAPGLLDRAVPVRRPVRHPARQGQAEEGQQLRPRRRRAGRHRRRPAPPPSSASGTARIARRRGKAIAQVAVARSIMIIVWHLLADPAARYHDLGPDWHARRINRDKKIRNHIRGLNALGLTVTITGDEQAA